MRVLNKHLMKVAIHEIKLARNVKLGDQHLVLGLHGLAFLFLNDVPDLANFALTGRPHLDQTLSEHVVP